MQLPFNTNDDIFEFFDEADEDWLLRKDALKKYLTAATACVGNMRDFVAVVMTTLFTDRYQRSYNVGKLK